MIGSMEVVIIRYINITKKLQSNKTRQTVTEIIQVGDLKQNKTPKNKETTATVTHKCQMCKYYSRYNICQCLFPGKIQIQFKVINCLNIALSPDNTMYVNHHYHFFE